MCSHPVPQDLAVQYIDARDLAAFAIDTALNGAVNTLSRPGHTTMAELLDLLSHEGHRFDRDLHVGGRGLPAGAQGRAVEGAADLGAAGRRHGELLHVRFVARALRSGLSCRSARETVADTWSWLRDNPGWSPIVTANRSRVGMDPEREAALLAAWADQPPAAL